MNEINYYKNSLEIIDNVLKGLDRGNNIPIEEFTMWYYFIELIGETNYNDLIKEEYFENFHKFFRQADIDMDLYRAPIHQETITSISSDDMTSYKERKTYRRYIDTNESPKIQALIWNFISISMVPMYVWDKIKAC